MVAIVVLTPEEYAIAVAGAMNEPGFKPFPGSRRAREMELEWEREQAARDEEEDAADVKEVGSRPFSFALEVDRSFQRVGAARYWKRSSRTQALLVTSSHGELRVVAVGTVEGQPRGRYEGTRYLTVRIRELLSAPISLRAAIDALSPRQRTIANDMMVGPSRPLSPELSRSLVGVLSEMHPDLQDVFARTQRALNDEAVAHARSRLPRATRLVGEAMSSALHMFRGSWQSLEPERDPQPSEFALVVEELAVANENDVISDDADVFPGWDRAQYSRGGWWEFHSKGRRLLVKNINVSTQENATGADLVYVRRDPDAFVLVQYKLLETLSDGRAVFRPDGRLDSQISRMLTLESMSRGAVSADDQESYRLGGGFSFVKFVAPTSTPKQKPGELAEGFYLPSEFARRTLLNPESGPNGGTVYYIAEGRHISSEMFARLVRDNWVGSTGDATDRLRELFGIKESGSSIVLAVEEPLAGPEH